MSLDDRSSAEEIAGHIFLLQVIGYFIKNLVWVPLDRQMAINWKLLLTKLATRKLFHDLSGGYEATVADLHARTSKGC